VIVLPLDSGVHVGWEKKEDFLRFLKDGPTLSDEELHRIDAVKRSFAIGHSTILIDTSILAGYLKRKEKENTVCIISTRPVRKYACPQSRSSKSFRL
jgi:hypothetical protein